MCAMALSPLTVPSKLASDLQAGTRREWLETNGLGSFAMGTVAGPCTRRYHALLCYATRPPVGRMVLVNRCEETLLIEDQRHELSCSFYPGTVHPDGNQRLVGFRLDPWPTWSFKAGDLTLERCVFMPHERQYTVVYFRLIGATGRRVRLLVRPLISGRDYHALHHENEVLKPAAAIADGRVMFHPYEGVPPIVIHHNGEYRHEPWWYRRVEYPAERARGLDAEEDLFSPGELCFELSSGEATMVFGARDEASPEVMGLRRTERTRRAELTGELDGLPGRLLCAADQFIVRRERHRSIIAGYPWFTDWGRDTFIALRGLLLARGGVELARDLLLAFAAHLQGGLIPNRFPDGGESPEYHSVDAPLWFVLAVCRTLRVAEEVAPTRGHEADHAALVSAIQQVIDGYLSGTRFGIGVDDDGLIFAAQPGVALTWMDARVGEWVVTPRAGKPVEVQALWVAALEAGARRLARAQPAYARELEERAAWARSSFAALFWNDALGYLYDAIDGARRDATLRPNQLFALGLCAPLIDGERAERALTRCERDLLTPRGLRTRARGPGYHGRVEGDPRARDGAYHEGTVWPYLLGAYADACKRVRGGLPDGLLDGIAQHVAAEGLGTCHEIFDGDAPHKPRGCPAQAWSVTELLRISLGRVGEDA
jgi:predicted glycogen debranching enzyme